MSGRWSLLGTVVLLARLVFMTGPAALAADAGPPAFTLNEGDHVAFVGNTFAERMVQFGYFEALLQSRFPNHKLVIRNLGWSSDTPSLQPRPLNFGDVHTHLANQKADVIFLCFAMNESFGGPEGLARFEQEMNAFIDGLREQKYNGRSPPRLVLVGPVPH